MLDTDLSSSSDSSDSEGRKEQPASQQEPQPESFLQQWLASLGEELCNHGALEVYLVTISRVLLSTQGPPA